jgi:probable H4MPT-linked C1 transfer pathway protein
VRVLGWDVGGANLKAARWAEGRIELLETPFALWREPDRLPDRLREVAERLGGAGTMAVTMTAELADCFPTKRHGVRFVVDAFSRAFPSAEAWYFGVDARFHSDAESRRRPLVLAAANWVASATLAARTCPDAFLIDCGSTTTDIIPIVGGRVAAAGRSDFGRLRRGELVYTGCLRTPVCAIVRSLPVRGRPCRVAAETFAIAADAHLWLGSIGDEDYTCDTPDGRGRTRELAGARLLRMVCSDFGALGPEIATEIALAVQRAQVAQIASALRQVERRLGASAPRAFLALGKGSFLATEAAKDSGLAPREGIEALGPAAAVASLLQESVQA